MFSKLMNFEAEALRFEICSMLLPCRFWQDLADEYLNPTIDVDTAESALLTVEDM